MTRGPTALREDSPYVTAVMTMYAQADQPADLFGDVSVGDLAGARPRSAYGFPSGRDSRLNRHRVPIASVPQPHI
ncbi:hypothetical protein [Saccharopolyspora sp. ASAGF58]|uniref:hypothetical protein n=1 Tax=Saccharopolyspora sp. ASAGF58 TaxID=2719023 RepID=UPI00143FD8AB|nr:hypothetical protein [Saccharopolyspora sp. ASAGF58]QIZ38437.1 hypothetical protein FDZ84_32790 [Saccharopolyspora sp. ASAGF58]